VFFLGPIVGDFVMYIVFILLNVLLTNFCVAAESVGQFCDTPSRAACLDLLKASQQENFLLPIGRDGKNYSHLLSEDSEIINMVAARQAWAPELTKPIWSLMHKGLVILKNHFSQDIVSTIKMGAPINIQVVTKLLRGISAALVGSDYVGRKEWSQEYGTIFIPEVWPQNDYGVFGEQMESAIFVWEDEHMSQGHHISFKTCGVAKNRFRFLKKNEQDELSKAHMQVILLSVLAKAGCPQEPLLEIVKKDDALCKRAIEYTRDVWIEKCIFQGCLKGLENLLCTHTILSRRFADMTGADCIVDVLCGQPAGCDVYSVWRRVFPPKRSGRDVLENLKAISDCFFNRFQNQASAELRWFVWYCQQVLEPLYCKRGGLPNCFLDLAEVITQILYVYEESWGLTESSNNACALLAKELTNFVREKNCLVCGDLQSVPNFQCPQQVSIYCEATLNTDSVARRFWQDLWAVIANIYPRGIEKLDMTNFSWTQMRSFLKEGDARMLEEKHHGMIERALSLREGVLYRVHLQTPKVLMQYFSAPASFSIDALDFEDPTFATGTIQDITLSCVLKNFCAHNDLLINEEIRFALMQYEAGNIGDDAICVCLGSYLRFLEVVKKYSGALLCREGLQKLQKHFGGDSKEVCYLEDSVFPYYLQDLFINVLYQPAHIYNLYSDFDLMRLWLATLRWIPLLRYDSEKAFDSRLLFVQIDNASGVYSHAMQEIAAEVAVLSALKTSAFHPSGMVACWQSLGIIFGNAKCLLDGKSRTQYVADIFV